MNPGAETLTVQLSRDAAGQPWGFRLQGGADFATPLSVQSVRVCLKNIIIEYTEYTQLL